MARDSGESTVNMHTDKTYIKRIKAEIRQRIWSLLESSNIASFPRPVYGRIPNFKGAEIAAHKISTLREWQSARVVKSNPDAPQYYLRLRALEEGKVLIMASPKLRAGFILLDPKNIPRSKLQQAATISGAFKYGKIARLVDLPKIDIVITGCVAVDRKGARLGKGGGFAELEYGILRELGLIEEHTPIATTVHDLQVVNELIPIEIHDFTVDCYATPTKLVWVDSVAKYRPKGIYWGLLTRELKELSVIKELLELKTSRK